MVSILVVSCFVYVLRGEPGRKMITKSGVYTEGNTTISMSLKSNIAFYLSTSPYLLGHYRISNSELNLRSLMAFICCKDNTIYPLRCVEPLFTYRKECDLALPIWGLSARHQTRPHLKPARPPPFQPVSPSYSPNVTALSSLSIKPPSTYISVRHFTFLAG